MKLDRDDVLDLVELGIGVAISVGITRFILHPELAENFLNKIQKLPKIKIVKIK